MRFFQMALAAAGTAQIVKAHTAFTNFFVDGVDQGDGVAVRMSNNMGQATFPISSVTSNDMACGRSGSKISTLTLGLRNISLIDVTGVNGETGVSRVAGVKAGSKITFEWRDWPDGTKPGSIDPSHKGPCAVYMKKVDDSSASNNAAGDGWFKIMEDGYDSTAKKWCTEKLIPNNGHLQATIPKDLAPGYYLMRPELLALHATQATPPDPQFYVGCAQVFLTSDGSATPKDHVSIPGYVNMQTPAMTYNIYATPLKLPFPDFGPPLYNPGSSERSLVTRDMTQTIGLKPADCVMENGNWCAVMPPSYTDQNGCWNVSVPSEKFSQPNTLTSRSPPRTAGPKTQPVTSQPAQPGGRTATSGRITARNCKANAALGTTTVRPLRKTRCQRNSQRSRVESWP